MDVRFNLSHCNSDHSFTSSTVIRQEERENAPKTTGFLHLFPASIFDDTYSYLNGCWKQKQRCGKDWKEELSHLQLHPEEECLPVLLSPFIATIRSALLVVHPLILRLRSSLLPPIRISSVLLTSILGKEFPASLNESFSLYFPFGLYAVCVIFSPLRLFSPDLFLPPLLLLTFSSGSRLSYPLILFLASGMMCIMDGFCSFERKTERDMRYSVVWTFPDPKHLRSTQGLKKKKDLVQVFFCSSETAFSRETKWSKNTVLGIVVLYSETRALELFPKMILETVRVGGGRAESFFHAIKMDFSCPFY